MAKAYLEITLKINQEDREAAVGVYNKFKVPFLETIQGALSKELLVHVEDIQALHGFETAADAQTYLLSELFNKDVVMTLKPFLKDNPDIKIYTVV